MAAGNVTVQYLPPGERAETSRTTLLDAAAGRNRERHRHLPRLPGHPAAPAARPRRGAGHARHAGAGERGRRPRRLPHPRRPDRAAPDPGGLDPRGTRCRPGRREHPAGQWRRSPDGPARAGVRQPRRASHPEPDPARPASRQVGRPRGPRRQPERGQEHRLQRPHRPAAAHRQLARQDHRARRGSVRAPRLAREARRPAGHLLAAGGQRGRGGGSRVHPVRPAGRDRGGRRRHAARTQPEPRAPDSRHHGSRGRLRQPGGRSPAPRHRDRRGAARAGAGRAGRGRLRPIVGRHRRASGRRPRKSPPAGRARGRSGSPSSLPTSRKRSPLWPRWSTRSFRACPAAAGWRSAC